MLHDEFRDAGYKVFGLLGANDHDGTELPEKMAFKKPWSSGWQHTPDWSDEQWDTFHELGMFKTGYGVLMSGLLVIDVDARNGGVESYERLASEIPEITSAGLIVETGSGGGSKHLYFKSPDCALVQSLKGYDGIDFKSSGYVVGPGSMHASGNRYRAVYGSPDDIEEAPQALIDLLRKPEHHRNEYNGSVMDVSHADIADMLQHIGGYDDYESWVEVGMCIHHATDGTGFDVWDQWSQLSDKYNSDDMLRKWHSFGKSGNPKTIGTLIHLAQEGGWQQSVTFTPDMELIADEPRLPEEHEVDLLRPPGFVGEVAAWIEAQSRRPRERLAVAAALTAIGNIAGLRYYDERDNVTSNLFTFCVAGSRTGKESIQQSMSEIHAVAGISAASHGSIKSEQEIMRNIALRHQAAFYIVDEIGIFLQKVKNAQQRGGAAYLEGVIGILMSAYSKANGRMLITGDLKDDIRSQIGKEVAAMNRRKDEGDKVDESVIAKLTEKMRSLDEGLVRPFVSVIGFTTPVTFDGLVDFDMATNGFIGRSLLFEEKETAPRSKRGFRRTAMPSAMQNRLQALYMAGHYDMAQGCVEELGDRLPVRTDAAASHMLDDIVDWFEDRAEEHRSMTGLEALYLGAYELVAKVSLILAVPTGVRTTEHVRWAFALVRRDIDAKMHLVVSNTSDKGKSAVALQSAIAHAVGDEGLTIGILRNRLARRWSKDDVDKMVDLLVERGKLIREERTAGRGKTTQHIRLAQQDA